MDDIICLFNSESDADNFCFSKTTATQNKIHN